MTVLGPVDSGDRGDAAARARLPRPDRERLGRAAERPGPGRARARAVRRSGWPTVVDVTSVGLARIAALRSMATRTGLNIVMGRGFYRRAYFPAAVDELSTDAVADWIVRDIEEGVDGVRAGIIMEIGCDRVMTALEERSFRARRRAQRRTGLSITTHAARWPVGLPQLDLLMEEGVDLRRVVIGHCDMVPDHDYHLEPRAARGVRAVRHRAGGERVRHPLPAGLIRSLAEEGYSTGCCSARTSASGRTTPGGRGTPTSHLAAPTGCATRASRRPTSTAAGRQPAADAHGRVAGRPYLASASSSPWSRARWCRPSRSSSTRRGSR